MKAWALSDAALGERDALLQRARSLRQDNAPAEALAVLDRLAALHPEFSRLHQERGHCHVLRRDAAAAIAALEEAVRLNPTLPASWDMLAQLHGMAGDAERATAAQRNVALLRELPVEVVAANSLYADGDLGPAEAVIRDYLKQDPGNAGAARLLARICLDRGALREAEALLRGLLARAPDFLEARLDLAMVLLQQQKHLQARQEAELLLAKDPANRDYLKQYGAACLGLGDHEQVIDLFAALLDSAPQSPLEVAELRLWRANALKVTGRRTEAVADYHAALEARPDYGVAWFSLANLKTYRFRDSEVAAMTAAEARPGLDPADRIYLSFALGKALEDRGSYEASWRYYARGNALRRESASYRPAAAEACAAALQQHLTAEFFAARTGWGSPAADPLFIVGLPRSGSTLTEQILASHSQIEGTHELTEIGRIAAELCGADPACGLPLHPEALRHLSEADARALGERFLAETRTYRRLGRPFFIDKMPNNFWHVGLIHLILPRARIIDVRREPMACCFSNLKQLFGTTNQEFSYGQEDMARHYRVYLELMRHWQAVLPGRVIRLRYEDLVADLEGTVRDLLGRCDLPFEPACLTFHQTRRSIRTPSSEQVRRPIGRSGLLRWRNYAEWLGPLREALGDAVTRWEE